MPAKKLSRTDFESRFFDLLENKIDGMDKRIDTLTAEIQNLKNQAKTPVTSWYSDKKLAYIALTCVLVFLLIAAAVLGVEVPKL